MNGVYDRVEKFFYATDELISCDDEYEEAASELLPHLLWTESSIQTSARVFDHCMIMFSSMLYNNLHVRETVTADVTVRALDQPLDHPSLVLIPRFSPISVDETATPAPRLHAQSATSSSMR